MTQIMPVRYIARRPNSWITLRPLLSDDASTIASNDNSQRRHPHRHAGEHPPHRRDHPRARQFSVSSISVIRVYTLRYADAKELADVITQLFDVRHVEQ